VSRDALSKIVDTGTFRSARAGDDVVPSQVVLDLGRLFLLSMLVFSNKVGPAGLPGRDRGVEGARTGCALAS